MSKKILHPNVEIPSFAWHEDSILGSTLWEHLKNHELATCTANNWLGHSLLGKWLYKSGSLPYLFGKGYGQYGVDYISTDGVRGNIIGILIEAVKWDEDGREIDRKMFHTIVKKDVFDNQTAESVKQWATEERERQIKLNADKIKELEGRFEA